jgi:hypothetical protein
LLLAGLSCAWDGLGVLRFPEEEAPESDPPLARVLVARLVVLGDVLVKANADGLPNCNPGRQEGRVGACRLGMEMGVGGR